MAIRRDLIKLGIAGAVLGAPAVLRAQQPYKTEYRMSIAPPSNVFAWGKGQNDSPPSRASARMVGSPSSPIGARA